VNQKTKAHIALLITNIFFAINFTAVKFLISGGFIQPFGLNLIRVAVTAMLLWVLFIFKSQKVTFQKKDYPRLVLCALTGVAINQLLFIKGLSYTYPIHASLLLLITPILITIIASLVLKEKITSFKIIGLLLGVSGAMVLILSKEKTGNASDVLVGDVLIIINAISYTFYFVLVKPLMKEYNPIAILRMVFSIGFFMILPFCVKEFSAIEWLSYGRQEFLALILIVLGGTFFAYLFNIYGIKILGASTAGAYIYSQPLFAAVIAISFLGEEIVAYKIIAGVLIFAGVFIANKQITTNENNNST
jgi:drug/metabolite transporter (DMT)-like permease